MHDFFERLHSAGMWRSAPFTSLEEFGQTMKASITRQYVGDAANDKRPNLRVSSIGKPAVLGALGLPAVQNEVAALLAGLPPRDTPDDDDGDITERVRLIFSIGDWYEAWVAFQLDRLGYDRVAIPADQRSEDDQWRVEYKVPDLDAPVVGHLDHVVDTEDGRYILEVKTMSDSYWRSFTGAGYNFKDDYLVSEGGGNDDRGYMTQLALYTAATGFKGAWLALNKATAQQALVFPAESDLAAATARANKVATALSRIKTIRDVFDLVKAPPGVPEVYRRSATGRLLIPTSMKYSGVSHLFYHIQVEKNGYGKQTEYIGEFDPDLYGELSERDYVEYTDYKTYDDLGL